MAKRLIPTGECWCGCGSETDLGRFFLSGHDKRAEGRVITEVYGGVPGFLTKHGYAPGGAKWSTDKFVWKKGDVKRQEKAR